MKVFIYFLIYLVINVLVISMLPETGTSEQKLNELKTEIITLKIQLQDCNGTTEKLEKLAK